MMMGSTGVAAAAAASGLACSGSEASASEPKVRFGEESCSRCGMVIDDRRFAAAWITPQNDERHFDDMVCLLGAAAEEAPPAGSRYFASDFDSETWLDATTARYVVSPDITSPMASGIAAHGTAEAADRHAHDHAASTHGWHDLPAIARQLGDGMGGPSGGTGHR